jgi:hypothetical protein
MKTRKIILYLAGIVAVSVLLLAYVIIMPERTPDIPAPPGSTNVHFNRYSGWQFMRYYYRIDNDPIVSINFVKSLMDKHLRPWGRIEITEEPFVRFPASGTFPKWFDPDSITNGILITGNNWIYSVVDTNTGRMFYYYGH